MDEITSQVLLYLAAAGLVGAGLGWLIRGSSNSRLIDKINDEWQSKLDDMIRKRDSLVAETATLRSNIEDQESAGSKRIVRRRGE